MALFLKALSTQGSRPKVDAIHYLDSVIHCRSTSRGSTNTSKSTAFRNRLERRHEKAELEANEANERQCVDSMTSSIECQLGSKIGTDH